MSDQDTPLEIDWVVEAAGFYAARNQAADDLTIQLMAHHMERVFNQEVSEDV